MASRVLRRNIDLYFYLFYFFVKSFVSWGAKNLANVRRAYQQSFLVLVREVASKQRQNTAKVKAVYQTREDMMNKAF